MKKVESGEFKRNQQYRRRDQIEISGIPKQ